ncbi:hypothetical protein [Methylococcus sp. EFPC2]|uniref:hypothetical protein n=1 Tax=Methylococcus sp. EFPC2 TaxID=2812648 RepID=UPI0019675F64|nr:hypothetical protein [Methylococcus sp. EFPC2]QSA96363.1 hypothetical protein JWZ97_14220 [Methylococcus sp. EFPC2]
MNVTYWKWVVAFASSVFVMASAQAAGWQIYSSQFAQPYNASDATKIDYLTDGARSFATYPTSLIFPFVRASTGTTGASAWVQSYLSSGTLSATIYSFRENGTLITSRSGSTSTTGWSQFNLNFTGAGNSEFYGRYSALVTVPANSQGHLKGIELYDN